MSENRERTGISIDDAWGGIDEDERRGPGPERTPKDLELISFGVMRDTRKAYREFRGFCALLRMKAHRRLSMARVERALRRVAVRHEGRILQAMGGVQLGERDVHTEDLVRIIELAFGLTPPRPGDGTGASAVSLDDLR